MKPTIEEWQLMAANQINNMWIRAQEGRALPPDARTVARIIAERMPPQKGDEGDIEVAS